MRVTRLLLLLCLAGFASAQDSFDHESHEDYFPLCISCHGGIEQGTDPYPPQNFCGSCHDDERVPVVDWRGPERAPSRLRFDHREHVARARHSGQTLECRQCHDPQASDFRMAVEPLAAETCFACHGEARPHYEQEGRCETCHVPLHEFAGEVTQQPKPDSHLAADFLSSSGHALDATHFASDCAVCHARESCERCHRNASDLEIVQELQPDARIAQWLSGELALYPTPADHDAAWLREHGQAADASCANCHAQSSCSDCHLEGNAIALIRALPELRPGESDPTRRTRLAFHPQGWVTQHGGPAALDAEQCASCHAQQSCEDCHSGELEAGYHGPMFLERHGTELYAGLSDCSRCHNNESFCRECHADLGMGSEGLLGGSFHDQGPLWLLQHAEAARFELASCASCHAQTDCLRCHSQKGGWAVSPHGPDFAGSALADGNLSVCAICHFDDPR